MAKKNKNLTLAQVRKWRREYMKTYREKQKADISTNNNKQNETHKSIQ